MFFVINIFPRKISRESERKLAENGKWRESLEGEFYYLLEKNIKQLPSDKGRQVHCLVGLFSTFLVLFCSLSFTLLSFSFFTILPLNYWNIKICPLLVEHSNYICLGIITSVLGGHIMKNRLSVMFETNIIFGGQMRNPMVTSTLSQPWLKNACFTQTTPTTTFLFELFLLIYS